MLQTEPDQEPLAEVKAAPTDAEPVQSVAHEGQAEVQAEAETTEAPQAGGDGLDVSTPLVETSTDGSQLLHGGGLNMEAATEAAVDTTVADNASANAGPEARAEDVGAHQTDVEELTGVEPPALQYGDVSSSDNFSSVDEDKKEDVNVVEETVQHYIESSKFFVSSFMSRSFPNSFQGSLTFLPYVPL
jgi:hypothetical protein